MIRREFLQYLAASAALPALTGPAQAAETMPFSKAKLLDLARMIADAPYMPPGEAPQAWKDLSYGDYKSIRFNVDKSVWSGTNSPAQLDVLHPGIYFRRLVQVNLVEDGMTRALPFDWDFYHKSDVVAHLPVDDRLGYAGIRLRTELERRGVFQEYAVFQGASYFRLVGRDQVYGLSARGLTVETAGPNGEEFPDFTQFWVERPEPRAASQTIHALMESPSVTGMYHFTITPGAETEVEVECTLFPRRDLDNVGIAPLTSMFFFDETNRGGVQDYRTSVHDSDGLLVHNGSGEVLWRPLANHKTLQVSHFVDENPRGFGLMQRSRSFAEFGDIEAQFERRPNLWITPRGEWGAGSVMLVEIPTAQENFDNIVAAWKPATPLMAGSERRFEYSMTWGLRDPAVEPVAPVAASLIGRAAYNPEKSVFTWIEGATSDRNTQFEFRVDFARHDAVPDVADLTVSVGTNRGLISAGVIQKNPETGGARVAFAFDPLDETSAELRVQLMHHDRRVSEVWLYRWTA